MTWETAAQQAVFDALNGNLTGCTVFDTAPFLPEGAPSTTFPYCVIGDDTFAPWDTDDGTGSQNTVTLHFWSRATGYAPLKALMGEAYALLHRQSLTLAGYDVVDCLIEFSEAMADPDGVTKRYRLTMTAA
jgi:Protein of unknown function (DUF3168)